MFERFDDEAQAIAREAPQEARGLFHAHIDTSHLLLALVRSDTMPSILLRCMAVTYDVLVLAAFEAGRGTVSRPSSKMTCDDEYYRVLLTAYSEADRFGSARVTPMHVLRAMLIPPTSAATRAIEGVGLSRLRVLERTKAALR